MPDTPALRWLRTHGNQRRLRDLVQRLTGRSVAQSTTTRWATGKRPIDPFAEALILLLSAMEGQSADVQARVLSGTLVWNRDRRLMPATTPDPG